MWSKCDSSKSKARAMARMSFLLKERMAALYSYMILRKLSGEVGHWLPFWG